MWPRLLAEGEDEEAVDGTRLPLNPASGIMNGGTAQLTDEPLVAFARAATLRPAAASVGAAAIRIRAQLGDEIHDNSLTCPLCVGLSVIVFCF